MFQFNVLFISVLLDIAIKMKLKYFWCYFGFWFKS